MIYQILKQYITLATVCLPSFLFLITSPVQAQTLLEEKNIPDSTNLRLEQEQNSGMNEITNVRELRDVSQSDWAYQALQSLVERYGCISGFPNQTFAGDRSLSRYEFAAALNGCLNKIEKLIASSQAMTSEDLQTRQRLTQEFATELGSLGTRLDQLENRTAILEDNQFSTTSKLRGQVIISANAGGFNSDRIIDPLGRQLADSDPEATILYRAGLDFISSFFGDDSLLIRLEGATGSTINDFRGVDNASAVLEPFFGSGIDYSSEPPTENGDVEIGRLVYNFKPLPNLTVSLGPDIRATDYIDRNSYANLSFLDFSSELFVNNLILFPVNGPAGGAAIDWQPGKGAFSLRALYAATEASDPGGQPTRPIIGTAPFTRILFPQETGNPNAGGERGFFGDTYQGMVEAEYAPSRSFAVRLQYSGGQLFSNQFDVIGANAEYSFSPKLGLFGRYGYGNFDETIFGDLDANYWMAGIASRDLFKEGSLAGLAVGQPFIADEVGDGTQTNYEVFYNYPVNRNIQITPSFQVITNAGNQDSNDTIFTGTMRTVLSF